MVSLRYIMRANSVSCLAFGFLFAIKPALVAAFLGGTSPAPTWIFLLLGVVLIFNGLHLFWASNIQLPKKELILYFSIGDYVWVVASAGLMFCGIWVTTLEGIVATSVVAIMVGLFGVLQMISRKSMDHC